MDIDGSDCSTDVDFASHCQQYSPMLEFGNEDTFVYASEADYEEGSLALGILNLLSHHNGVSIIIHKANF